MAAFHRTGICRLGPCHRPIRHISCPFQLERQLNKSSASEAESFDLFIYFADFISITHFYHPTPPRLGPLSHLFPGSVRGAAYHRRSPRAGTQAHRPRSNYGERERTFLLFRDRGISMVAVQSLNYSSILEQRGERKSCWDLRGCRSRRLATRAF